MVDKGVVLTSGLINARDQRYFYYFYRLQAPSLEKMVTCQGCTQTICEMLRVDTDLL